MCDGRSTKYQSNHHINRHEPPYRRLSKRRNGPISPYLPPSPSTAPSPRRRRPSHHRSRIRRNLLLLFLNPHIHHLDFHIDPVSPSANVDPFFLRYDTISRSAHHLARLLSTLSPPISAAFSDVLFTKGFNMTTTDLPYKNYTVITTSARFLSLMAHLPHLGLLQPSRSVEIPGLDPIPFDNIPPPFFNPDHIFTSLIVSDARYFHLSQGILVNTFESLEPETLSALPNLLPEIFPIGPLKALEEENKNDELMSWLDEQLDKSVVYVSFGNRTALSRDQIRELGIGLERSGSRFIWVVKTSMIDKEEEEELSEILGV